MEKKEFNNDSKLTNNDAHKFDQFEYGRHHIRRQLTCVLLAILAFFALILFLSIWFASAMDLH